MQIPILRRGGGSSVGFNFNIVGGTTQPENPKENTIWVNTENEITGWVFSSAEPSDPVEGLVWIVTGKSSATEFNALKENAAYIYPIFVKQYVSGAWVYETAMTYQNGAWESWWDGELYVNGNTYDDFTGGINPYAYKISTAGSTVTSFTLTNSNGIMQTSVIESMKIGTIFTENAIDLTGFSLLRINATDRTGSAQQINMGVTKTKVNNYTYAASVEVGSTGVTTLDVSTLTGEYYCVICIGGTGNKQLSFDEWKLVV